MIETTDSIIMGYTKLYIGGFLDLFYLIHFIGIVKWKNNFLFRGTYKTKEFGSHCIIYYNMLASYWTA